MNQIHVITRMDKENPISNYSSIYNLDKIDKALPSLRASLYPIIKKMLLSTNFIYSHIKHRLFLWLLFNAFTLGFIALICFYSYYELNGVFNLRYLSIGYYLVPIITYYYYRYKDKENLLKMSMSRIAQFILNNENQCNDCFNLFIKDNFDLMVNIKTTNNPESIIERENKEQSLTPYYLNNTPCDANMVANQEILSLIQSYFSINNNSSCMRLINYVINIPRGLYSLSYYDHLLRIREKEIISEILSFVKMQVHKARTSIFNKYLYPLISLLFLFCYIRQCPMQHLNEVYWLLGTFGALAFYSIFSYKKKNFRLLVNYCQEKNKELTKEGYYIYISELMISLFSINNLTSFEPSIFAQEITAYLYV